MKEYKPMLAVLGDKSYLKKKGYIYEPKVDGYRTLCYKNSSIKLISRKGNDVTSSYPELKLLKNIKAKTAVIDGEIVVYNEKGIPDFQLMQGRDMHSFPVSYIVFDILEKNGKDLTSLPLLERKKILEQTIKEGKNIEVNYFTNHGNQLWNFIKKKGLEGVLAKKPDSKYYQTRSSAWVKVKITQSIDVIIIGYQKKKREIGSLLMGIYDKGELKFFGKVGTGFNSLVLVNLTKKFEKIKTDKNPTSSIIKEKNVTWLKPKLVAEIEYAEITEDKKLRVPSFKGLRKDKKPEECTLSSQI